MRTKTKEKLLEKTEKALIRIRNEEKENTQKAKSLRLAIENKKKKEENKKRTHALILIGEFIYTNYFTKPHFTDFLKKDILEKIKYLQKNLSSEENEKEAKKIQRQINNFQIILDYISHCEN